MSQFSFFLSRRSRLLGGLLSLVFMSSMGVAWADGSARTDDDDPAVNEKGVVVNNILAVLRDHTHVVSTACVNNLHEMRKVQKQLDVEETAQRSFDVGLVRDVLESDMESVIKSCGKDARTACGEGVGQGDSRLGKICSQLAEMDMDSEGDDLQ